MELSLRPCSPLTDSGPSCASTVRPERFHIRCSEVPDVEPCNMLDPFTPRPNLGSCGSMSLCPSDDSALSEILSKMQKSSYGVSCHRVDMGGTAGDQVVSLHTTKPESAWEHVRNLAEFWAEAARPLGIAKHRTTTESEIAVPPGVAGSFGPGERDTTNAAATAVAKPAGEGRPLGRVPRRNLNSQRVPVVLNLLGPEQMA